MEAIMLIYNLLSLVRLLRTILPTRRIYLLYQWTLLLLRIKMLQKIFGYGLFLMKLGSSRMS